MIYALILISVLLGIKGLAAVYVNKRKANTANKQIDDLKSRGIRIKVNFNDCEIITNQYNEEVEREAPMQVQSTNVLLGDEMSNVENVEVETCQLLFTTDVAGKTQTYVSPVIKKAKDWLMWKLIAKGDTWLYIAPADPKTCYFDLDFLYQ